MSSLQRSAEAQPADQLDLVCASGHRTAHSLARISRLNDGWCGICGADIGYTPPANGAEIQPAIGSAGRRPQQLAAV